MSPPHASAPPLLRATNASRRDPLSARALLQPYSLDIRAGDSIVLTGATGSGKSLLLRSLALIDPLDGGEILFKGQPIAADAIPRYRAQVAYVRQRPVLLEGTVEANLRLPFSLGIHAARQFNPEAVQALLDALRQPAAFLGKLARDLSGGEAQLVSLVRVLQLDPCVLLLDEPTAALDVDTTAAVDALLASWLAAAPAARALLVVSHAPAQTARLGRRRLHIAAGQLQAETAPAYAAPRADAAAA